MYLLTPLAAKYLAALDIAVDTPIREAKVANLKAEPLRHNRYMNTAIMLFECACEASARYRLEEIYPERFFKKQPFVMPNKWKQIPDSAVLISRLGADGWESHLFAFEIQHDSNWTTGDIRQKVRHYLTIEEEGMHISHLGLPNDTSLWVLFFATQGETHARKIKRATEEEMKAQGKRDVNLFRIAPFTGENVYVEPVWQRPFRQDFRPLLIL